MKLQLQLIDSISRITLTDTSCSTGCTGRLFSGDLLLPILTTAAPLFQRNSQGGKEDPKEKN